MSEILLFGKQLQLSWATWLLFICSFCLLVSCDRTEAETVVVTEVVVVEGDEEIVTRVVRQTIAVTATPSSGDQTDNVPIELDVSLIGSLPIIDPQGVNSDNGLDLMENLFVGLTSYNHRTALIEPELASNWSVSSNGRVWTFTLRDDIFWMVPLNLIQRGGVGNKVVEATRPVIADDVVFALQRVCQREMDLPNTFILFIIEGCEQLYANPDQDSSILNVKALSDVELQITLTEPASQFLSMTALPLFYPVPRERITEFDDEWILPENLWVSGPFFPVTFAEGRIVLHRNPLWPTNLRPPQGNVDVVNILFLGSDMDGYDLWEAKSVDITPLPSEIEATVLAESPQKAQFVPEQSVFYLAYNFNSAVFREVEMRQAFAAAIDRERLVEELFNGSALDSRHLTPPGIVGAPPFEQTGLGYSPGDAQQFLAESGFRSCRLMPPITFLVNTSDLALRRAELIQQMWIETLGCTEDQIIIEQAEFGTLLANTRLDAGSSRPDLWELGWASYYPDAHNWVSDLLHCNKSENRPGRPCTEVDQLVDEAAVALDPSRRLALYRDAENALFGRGGEEPITPLYVPGDYILVQSWVIDHVPALFGGERYDTYEVDALLKRLERSR